ncbi:MAG: F0F1 ATP synthase subunit delta, partial [Xanthomonadales bacterium]|nr:F0F1 ATP synthase subunit delta [Xanthomonadales bacterium]
MAAASGLTTLARPYAKAAFELARAEDALSRWDELLAVAGNIVASEEMARLLKDPMVARERVVAILVDALGEQAGDSFAGFIRVLGENDRLALLPSISELFRELREEHEGRLSVRVVSAVPL